jgi:hypothetical protein
MHQGHDIAQGAISHAQRTADTANQLWNLYKSIHQIGPRTGYRGRSRSASARAIGNAPLALQDQQADRLARALPPDLSREQVLALPDIVRDMRRQQAVAAVENRGRQARTINPAAATVHRLRQASRGPFSNLPTGAVQPLIDWFNQTAEWPMVPV